MPNRYMPISLTVRDRRALVVGGGTIALRKVENLLDYDMAVTVVAPECDPKLSYYAKRGSIVLEERPYRSPEAGTYSLVIAASDDQAVNQQVFDDTRHTGALCNVVDNPPLCDFAFPAVVKRQSLTLAVSTDGTAPFLAGHLRLILENIFPEHWNDLMKLAGHYRVEVQRRFAGDPGRKQLCYERFLEADWKTLLKEKSEQEIDAALESMMTM